MRAYLQLLRLPTVFTAMADIVLGFVLTHGLIYGPFPLQEGQLEPAIGWHHLDQFLGLLAASSCLYLSGMVFNDVFDQKQDLTERPTRPIPSGRVAAKAATRLGIILMTVGVGCAAMVSRVSLQVALLLVVAILSYDGILKRTLLGPFAMGSCRFLNVMLGASVQNDLFPSLVSLPQLAAATGLGLFIVGVTLFARTETRTSSRWQLGLAQFVMNVGFSIQVWLILTWPVGSPIEIPLAMLMVVAFTVNRRALDALNDPSPAKVQRGVKVMLLSLVFIDATLVFWFLNAPATAKYGASHALATAVLVVPALLLGRVIKMT